MDSFTDKPSEYDIRQHALQQSMDYMSLCFRNGASSVIAPLEIVENAEVFSRFLLADPKQQVPCAESSWGADVQTRADGAMVEAGIKPGRAVTSEPGRMDESTVKMPSIIRLEIMRIAICAVQEIQSCVQYESQDGKRDAAVVVAAILNAINELNRRNVYA